MIPAIGISHKDYHLAAAWVSWAAALFEVSPHGPIIIVTTRRIPLASVRVLKMAAGPMPAIFHAVPDEHELGYPGSASHLFLRTMQLATSECPGEPILWMEPDAIPTRPGWLAEIQQDYRTCGAPFMGHLELTVKPRHMAGVAVYPGDWQQRSPRLASCDRAPDIPQWGRHKGQAFDTYAAPEVFPQATQARTIQQVWNCPPITEENIDMIKPETALFHQCKTGQLIECLRHRMFQLA